MGDPGAGALYHLPAGRLSDQLDRMVELEAAGICFLCPEHAPTHLRQPVISVHEHWYVTRNGYPYAGVTDHLLIVPHRHVTSFDELPDEAGAELWAIRRQLKAERAPRATATIERSGDMRLNGGSVAHLHVHFVTLDSIPDEPVRFRVSGRSDSGSVAAADPPRSPRNGQA